MERLKQYRMIGYVTEMLTRVNSENINVIEMHPLLRDIPITILIFFVGCGTCHITSFFVELTGYAYFVIVVLVVILQHFERRGLFEKQNSTMDSKNSS